MQRWNGMEGVGASGPLPWRRRGARRQASEGTLRKRVEVLALREGSGNEGDAHDGLVVCGTKARRT